MGYPIRFFQADVSWADLKSEEFLYVPCNICGSFDFKALASLIINWGEFFLVQCKECGLIWRNPLPGRTFSYSLYSPEYFNVAKQSTAFTDVESLHHVGIAGSKLEDHVGIADVRPQDREFRDAISDEVVRTWISLGVQPTDATGKRRRLLEIGGGRGYLQRAAQRVGWETMGLEISPHGIKEAIANGLLVFPIPLDDFCTKYVPYKKYFDVIVAYDFLEHVDDPARVLRMIHFLLVDDGYFIFRIPETKACPRLHLIDHIWHFPCDVLDVLMQKEQLEIFYAHYSGQFKASNLETHENITFYAKKLAEPLAPRKLFIRPNPLEEWLKKYQEKKTKSACQETP